MVIVLLLKCAWLPHHAGVDTCRVAYVACTVGMFATFLHCLPAPVQWGDGSAHVVVLRLSRQADQPVSISATVDGTPFVTDLDVSTGRSWPRKGCLGLYHLSTSHTTKVYSMRVWATPEVAEPEPEPQPAARAGTTDGGCCTIQ